MESVGDVDRLREVTQAVERAEFSRGRSLLEDYVRDRGWNRAVVMLSARLSLKTDPARTIDQLRTHRRLLDDDGTRAESHMLQGAAHAHLNDFVSANARFAEAQRIARRAGVGDAIADLPMHRGFAAYLAGRKAASEREARRAVASPMPYLRARGYYLLALVENARERFLEQGDALLHALDELESSGTSDSELWANSLAALSFLARDLRTARFEERVLRDYERLPWTSELAATRFHTLRNMGWCHALRGDYFNGFRLLKRAAEMALLPAWQFVAHLDRAYLARCLGELRWSAQETTDARELAREISWAAQPPEIRHLLASFAEQIAHDDPEGARHYLVLAREHPPAPTTAARIDPRTEAMIDHMAGVVEARTGDPETAVALLRRAYDVYDRIDFDWRAGRTAIELARATGDDKWRRLAAQKLGGVERSWLWEELVAIGGVERGPASALTRAQRAVFELLCAGISTREIARRLGRSPYTVRNHIKAIFSTFGVNSRSALLVAAARANSAAPLRGLAATACGQ